MYVYVCVCVCVCKKVREPDDMKIGIEVQVYAPTLEPAAPICLAWEIEITLTTHHAMDSAHDFDLLGESVRQARVSARTLVLIFQFSYIYIHTYIIIYQDHRKNY